MARWLADCPAPYRGLITKATNPNSEAVGRTKS